MKYYFYLLAFLGICMLMSCASAITSQTAEVLEEDVEQITGGAALFYSLPQVELNDYEEANQIVPFIIVREGIHPKKEFQVLLTPNSLNFNVKKRLFANDKSQGAFSYGAGYTFLASSFDDQVHIADFTFTFYYSYKIVNNIKITLAPKLIPRWMGRASLLTGSSFNLSFGNKIKVIPEANFFYDIQQNNLFISGGIAYGF